MRKLLFLLSLVSVSLSSHGQQPGNLPKLIIFSGSDWCLPCIRLEKEIFSKPRFKEFCDGRVTILKVDFPQRNKLSPLIVKRNDSLASLYNPKGLFPKLVLVGSDGKKRADLPTEQTDLGQLIRDLNNLLLGERQEYRRKALLMGSAFEFVIVSNDRNQAERLLSEGEQEVSRLENLLSEWKPNTEVSQVNRASGINSVAVSLETYELTKRSLGLAAMTQGAFDISFHGLNAYDFDKREHGNFPDSSLIRKKLNLVDFEKVKLENPNRIFLEDTGMAIGFGASGKGFAADEVKRLWVGRGVKSGVINASGDLVAWGTRADGSPWRVAIADPEDPTKTLYWLPVKDQAVATSGSYEKYFEYQGKRYSHIINPLTGFPVTDKKSVTVISPSAELSDALATALFVLDIETGLDMIRQLPETECLIIDSDNEVYFSNKLQLMDNLKNP